MAGNPQLMALLSALSARSSMGGIPPGGSPAAVAGGPPSPVPGGPSGSPMAGPGAGGPGGGGDAGGDFSSMLSDLRGADPAVTMNQVKFIKQIFGAMLVHNMEPNPNVSGKIAKLIPHIDGVLKELERSAQVTGAVRQPIQMGAAMPTPTSGGTTGVGPGSMGAMGPGGA